MNAPSHFDFRNVNALWCSVLVETLVRTGVRHAVISPGSRSTPLTMALARHPLVKATPVLDERSAAFFALGMAKRTGAPAVLVCTSGTAGANYFPAVIEAQEGGVPLIVITADRPPEMRACASGQTIDQQKLFGDHVAFFHEFAVPVASESMLRYLRQTVAHAVERSRESAGPVHLNAPFRDPLPPVVQGDLASEFAGCDWSRFFSHLGPNVMAVTTAPLPRFLPDVHGVIVAGPAQPADPARYAAAVGEVARKLGWPVVADALSPLRQHADVVPHLVTSYDVILRNPSVAERLQPESILCVGNWPTSKVLRAWLEASSATTWLATERLDNRDALHGRARTLPLSLVALAAQLPTFAAPNGYERMWAMYEQKARSEIDGRLEAESGLFEGKAAWLLARHLPVETSLVVANSMPIRDAEYFFPASDRRLRLLCNRGANGIDGTLSTALGVAHDAGRPAVLLVGDLALLHDTNGFLLRSKFRGSLTIVLINNNGGGIFGHLPVAQFDPPFEEFFATPQDMDFAKLAAAYGVEHVLVRDWTHFTELVSVLPAGGLRVIEVRTDRKSDASKRKTWFADAAAKLG